jgi:uncharacterized protein (DUF736 family)
MKLGTFRADQDGLLTGSLCGLGIGVVKLVFEPETSKEGKPFMRVIADPAGDAYEVGAAFKKQKDELSYFSISFDSPVFKAPLHAALFPDRNQDGSYNLVWERPEQPKQEQPPKPARPRPQPKRGANAAAHRS